MPRGIRAAALLAAFTLLALGVSRIELVRAVSAGDSSYSASELRSVETPDETKVRELRGQEITQLKIALGRRLPPNRMAELYLRLAEIYLEAYRMDYLLEGRVFDKHMAAGSKAKAIDHSNSRPHLKTAIQACQGILKFNIAFPRMDEVYYFLGYNYGETGDARESAKYYNALVQKFPSSRYAGEAYREMGDARFAAADYRSAIGFYESAAQRSSAEALPRVLHKQAWSYYRVKQFERAVDTMKRAIEATRSSGEKFLSLREEAFRDMAVFMTETGRVDDALSYFQSAVPDKTFYPKVLEKLGRQYERNVEPAKATQVYESLLKTHPESDAAFRVLVKLVDLDLRRGHFKEALARVQDVSIPSGGASGSGGDETQVAAQNLRAMVRRTATEHHETFRKKGERSALEVADLYYTAYLKLFLAKDDPRNEKPEIQMYLAEVKRDLGKSKEASELYRLVIDSRDKRYAKEAGALWTASLSEAIRKAEPAGTAKAADPSDLEKEYISAADSLQDALGDTAEGREAALKAAEVLAGYKGEHKSAIKRLRKLISRSSRSPQAVTAARLWLQLITDRLPSVGSQQGSSVSNMSSEQIDALDDLKDAMKELRENSALLAADQESGKGKLKAQLTDQEQRLKILSIGASESSKDFASAAKGYEAFAREATQREIAEKAYANAISAYAKASDDASVERVSEAWLKRFEKSQRAFESLRVMATVFLIQGRFDASGHLFERLGTEGGEPDALETALRVFEGTGDQARFLRDSAIYVSRYKASPFYWSVVLRIAKAHDSAGRDSEAAKSYRDCMAGPPEVEAECGARLADLYLRSKNPAEARNVFRKVAGGGKKKEAQSPFVGYARFRLAEEAKDEKRFETLRLPESHLKIAMNQRVSHMETLSRAYSSAAEAGGPWAVAAMDRLAAWALRFADEIDQIPPPANSDAAAVAKFRRNLANVSGPIRKKAVETWAESYSRAASAEALSPALPEVSDRLADLRVPGFGRAQGPRPRLRIAGIAADGGSDGRTSAFEKTRERLTKSAQDASAWVDYGNLLWGSGKPLLAKIAYDRAVGLSPKNPAALNNRAVVALSSAGGMEDWLMAAEGAELLHKALRQDDFFLPAKANLASLYNYYRIFRKARPLWEQVLAKSSVPEAHDGLAVALQGAGSGSQAEASFQRATELGASSSRFASVYHVAARSSVSGGKDGAARCLSELAGLDEGGLQGFEKEAAGRLKGVCTLWGK